MPISSSLDHGIEARLKLLAEAQHRSPEAIASEAIQQYLERNGHPEGASEEDRHPSGKPWPRRNPVGGIITPV